MSPYRNCYSQSKKRNGRKRDSEPSYFVTVGRIGDMDYLDAVVEATGEHDSVLREILQEDHDEEEVQEFLSDAIRSKIRRDFVASRLKQTIENTATVPDLDDPPELPERSDEEPILVRKYLNLSKFVSLLQDGIWFSRLDNFDDDYEGRVSDKTVRHRFDKWEYLEFEDDPPPYDLRQMYAAEDEILRKQSFVSCWRYGGEESAVFWNAYIDDGNGVAVETTLDTLSSAMEGADREVLIGKVNYREYKGSDERFAANGVDRVFHKRIAFGDEKELRLLTRQQLNDLDLEVSETGDIDMELEADPGFNLKVDPEDLIERIILPPDINDRQLTQVVQLMEYHDITAEIWRSMLDVSPGTTAPIQVTGDDAGKIARDDMRHARLVDKSEYK